MALLVAMLTGLADRIEALRDALVGNLGGDPLINGIAESLGFSFEDLGAGFTTVANTVRSFTDNILPPDEWANRFNQAMDEAGLGDITLTLVESASPDAFAGECPEHDPAVRTPLLYLFELNFGDGLDWSIGEQDDSLIQLINDLADINIPTAALDIKADWSLGIDVDAKIGFGFDLDARSVGEFLVLDTAPSFQIDVDRVAAAITPATKVILLNTPANPTGVVATADVVRDLARLADDTGVTILSDELYRSYCYDAPFASPALHSDNVVVIDGFSKSHAMTGWRVGWVHGPKPVVDACTMLQQYTFVCAPQVGQWAALAALDAPMEAPLAECRRKRDLLMAGLRGHYRFVQPGGAFYLYPEAPGGSGKAFAERAVAEEKLLVVPGAVFGAADTHFRIAYTVTDATLDRGIAALRRLAETA
jgi:hypothetical protein